MCLSLMVLESHGLKIVARGVALHTQVTQVTWNK